MANLSSSHDDERDKLNKFKSSEKERYRAEQQRQDIKHKRQQEDLRMSFEHTLRELEQLQNEKRKALMEHETAKLKQLEEEHGLEFKEWRANLKPRKQRLEEEFAHQREEQDRFYGNSSDTGSNYFSALGTSQSQLPIAVANDGSHHHGNHALSHRHSGHSGHHHIHHERQASGSNSCTPPSTPGAVDRGPTGRERSHLI
jgi:hypothetical protein